jgi:hypothetical protein
MKLDRKTKLILSIPLIIVIILNVIVILMTYKYSNPTINILTIIFLLFLLVQLLTDYNYL